MTALIRDALDGIQVLGDCSKAKIRDDGVTGVVYEDVWLARCQCGGERVRTSTHSLEVSVNHIAVVEVGETTSDIRYLEAGVIVG